MAQKVGKDHRRLMDLAEAQGYTIKVTAKSHFQIRDPEGRIIAYTGGTTSDKRSLVKFRADLRRGGVITE